MSLNCPEVVSIEYASEHGLESRRSIHADAEGPDPKDVLWEAISAAQPRRVLEVGPGPGELSARIASELGAAVVAVDVSERMVELARGNGVDARVGDVQDLEFGDGVFDLVVAAWMLYDVDQWVTFPDAAAVRRYLASTILMKDAASRVPELDRPVRAGARTVVFVAEKAA